MLQGDSKRGRGAADGSAMATDRKADAMAASVHSAQPRGLHPSRMQVQFRLWG